MPVTMPVNKGRHGLAAATGNLFPDKILWHKTPQGSRNVDFIQLSPGNHSIITMIVEVASGARRSGFHRSLIGCSMPAAMVPAMPVAALWHLTAIWKPALMGFHSPNGKLYAYV